MNLQTQLETLQTHLRLLKEKEYINKLDTMFTSAKSDRLVMANEGIIKVFNVRVGNGILILKLSFMFMYEHYTKEVTINEFLQDYTVKEKI